MPNCCNYLNAPIDTITGEIDCCTLTLTGEVNDEPKTLFCVSLKEATIQTYSNSIFVAGQVIPFDVLGQIGITVQDLYDAKKACCESDGDTGGGDITVTIEQPPKSWKANGFYYDPVADPKGENPICTDIYVDNETGGKCEFPEGTPLEDLTESNLFNTENLIKMSNIPGLPNGESLKNVTGQIPVSICGPVTGTLADVLAEALLDSDFVLPDGSQPDGLIAVSLFPEYKGQTCKGTPITVQSATIDTRTLDGGEGYCVKLPFVDQDCDNFAGNCIDLTKVLEIPEGAGLVGEVVGANCDTDDTDPTVTAEG